MNHDEKLADEPLSIEMKIVPPGFRGGLVDKVELIPTGVFAVVIGVFGSRFADPVESKKSTHSPKYSVSRCDIVIRTALIGLQIVMSTESPSRRIAAAPGTCLSAKTQPDSQGPELRQAPAQAVDLCSAPQLSSLI